VKNRSQRSSAETLHPYQVEIAWSKTYASPDFVYLEAGLRLAVSNEELRVTFMLPSISKKDAMHREKPSCIMFRVGDHGAQPPPAADDRTCNLLKHKFGGPPSEFNFLFLRIRHVKQFQDSTNNLERIHAIHVRQRRHRKMFSRK
jgi:hypothetical protein